MQRARLDQRAKGKIINECPCDTLNLTYYEVYKELDLRTLYQKTILTYLNTCHKIRTNRWTRYLLSEGNQEGRDVNKLNGTRTLWNNTKTSKKDH